MPHHLQAIIWDYDGTLADTRYKNLTVTRQIVERITQRPFVDFPVLHSLEQYEAVTRVTTNWREMYQQQYSMTPEQVDRAGYLWTELQLADDTHVSMFTGIAETLSALRHFPHGIVSQNARSNIVNALKVHAIDQHFGCVIGFEEVDIRQQKPEPEGLLQCIERLTSHDSGFVLYIGDHDTDFKCARNARQRLQHQDSHLCILSVGAAYGCALAAHQWAIMPDYRLDAPGDLVALVESVSTSQAEN